MNRFKTYIFFALSTLLSLTGCKGSRIQENNSNSTELSPSQEKLMGEGWYIPKTVPEGELAKEYGIKSKYGQQDNYFDIEIGKGCDVAVKIVDTSTDKCIRYVLIPESSSVNVQMIPQGKYYLKLAYGKDWMEYDNGDGTIIGKFTKNVSYDRSVDVFDFGKKNSSDIVSYVLRINMTNTELQNNFGTMEITEEDFLQLDTIRMMTSKNNYGR